jgi:hypothetical protein
MKLLIPVLRKLGPTALLSVAFVFGVGATPQGKGHKGGRHGIHQSCIHSCNDTHKRELQLCKGRTGRDRSSCQQSINEQHRRCVQSCPK